MEQSERYQLVFSGDILPDQDPIKVCAKLAGMFRLSPSALKPAMAGERLILQYDLSYKQATRYQTQLEALGARVSCEPIAAPTVQVWEDDPLDFQITPPTAGPAVTAPLDTPREGQVTCPSCGQVQQKRTLCISCSIDMPRFIQAQEQAAAEAQAAREAARQAVLNKNKKEKNNPDDAFKYDNYGDMTAGEAPIWGLNLSGRMGRCYYFLGGFALTIPYIAAAIILALLLHGFSILVIGVIGLFWFYMMIRLSVLRLHDMNLSGWWVFAWFGFGVIGAVMPVAGAILYGLFSLALLLWPGSPDDNNYGIKPDKPSGLMIGLALILAILSVASYVTAGKEAMKYTDRYLQQEMETEQE